MRRNKGFSIAETAASMTIALPIAILIIFVAVEIAYSYLIKSCLSQAAREAARAMAVQYGSDPTIAQDQSKQQQILTTIRIANMVNDNAQFDTVRFDTTSTPQTVYVDVRYLSGQYSLPQFPYPDPLHLGANFRIGADSTYRLE